VPWPTKYEIEIRAATSVVGVLDVLDALWTAWQLKGKPETVLRSVDIWLQAAEKIDKSEKSLSASRDNLRGLWSGPAFEAFSGYMDRNIAATNQNKDALIAAAGFLVDIYLQVIAAYNEAVNQVVTAGIKLESIIGFLPGNENPAEKADIRQTLVTFATNIVTRHNTLRYTLAGYSANLARVKAEQVRLKTPNDIPPAVKDRGKWERV
jgi:uncharacterized protein YukE